MKHHLPPAARAFDGLLHQMQDKAVPIPLVLDLWALGHSASDIAAKLDIPGGHKGVTRIVEHARQIGDKRAVLHCGANGRLLGRPGRDGTTIRRGARTVKGKEVAILISKAKPKPVKLPPIKKLFCCNGHPRTPENVGARYHCLQCKREKDRAARAAKKAAP